MKDFFNYLHCKVDVFFQKNLQIRLVALDGFGLTVVFRELPFGPVVILEVKVEATALVAITVGNPQKTGEQKKRRRGDKTGIFMSRHV